MKTMTSRNLPLVAEHAYPAGRAMNVETAAEVMGLGVNGLRRHLNRVGHDQDGEPLYHLTPDGGKKLIWPDQLPRIRSTLPSPAAATKAPSKGPTSAATRGARQHRLAKLTGGGRR